MILVGTSGYSYQDWVGPFYPDGWEKKDMLSFYSNHFSFAEVNSTYYQMPNPFVVYQWNVKTPDRFQFVVKAHRSMTHTRDADANEYNSFQDALKPISENNKLACLLFQFPYSFHFSEQEMAYLKKVRDYLPESSICVEFRNHEWINQTTFDLLKKLNFGFVCVDEPNIKGLIKPVAVGIGDIGYVRFHGRNQGKWYNHKESYERYDYLYSQEELQEWVPRIHTLDKYVKKLYVAFNNHFRAQGVINGKMLQNLLL